MYYKSRMLERNMIFLIKWVYQCLNLSLGSNLNVSHFFCILLHFFVCYILFYFDRKFQSHAPNLIISTQENSLFFREKNSRFPKMSGHQQSIVSRRCSNQWLSSQSEVWIHQHSRRLRSGPIQQIIVQINWSISR